VVGPRGEGSITHIVRHAPSFIEPRSFSWIAFLSDLRFGPGKQTLDIVPVPEVHQTKDNKGQQAQGP
jgi:hypothetical protein